MPTTGRTKGRQAHSSLALVSEAIGVILIILTVAATLICDIRIVQSDMLSSDDSTLMVLISIPLGALAAFIAGFPWLVLGRFLRLQDRRDDQMRQLTYLVAKLPTLADVERIERSRSAPKSVLD